jgi:acetyl-CoA C-acetyltransferase/acetyl-CoA acyltransferase
MKTLRKKIYVAAGYNTTYFGSGRKEFHPKKPMPQFEDYLKETYKGTADQLGQAEFDEGVFTNFIAARFIKQANLPGFLPFMAPSLMNKPCTRVEGACGSGGLGVAYAVRSILSEMADSVLVVGGEIQNTMKAIYGADVLAAAGYHKAERKDGHAFFFPGVFSQRAGAYGEKYDAELARKGMAKWYELAITNARKNPKAQEHHNSNPNLFETGMTPPNAKFFLPNLNLFDCSKVTDGASSLVIASEEGLDKLGIDLKDAVEIVGISSAEGDITAAPEDWTYLSTTKVAVTNALEMAGIDKDALSALELHDCFSIAGMIALETIGFAERGKAGQFLLDGNTTVDGKIPTNMSGGLCGFGHPVGVSGVRQLVDLLHQFTNKAEQPINYSTPYGMMVCMGGNDKTVTSIVVKGTR